MSFGGEATAKFELADVAVALGVEDGAGVGVECSVNRDSSREGGGVLLAGGVRGGSTTSLFS